MQQSKSNKDNEHVKLKEMQQTVKPTGIEPDEQTIQLTYNKLNKTLFQFFRERDYQCFEAFKEGYNKSVSEDYTSIELLCNMNDLIYEYMYSHEKLTTEEKNNLSNLRKGIQLITQSIKQYTGKGKGSDKIFVAMIVGYTLKLLRNFYHD